MASIPGVEPIIKRHKRGKLRLRIEEMRETLSLCLPQMCGKPLLYHLLPVYVHRLDNELKCDNPP
ncbi:hypothetical protein T11_2271 [Trichinella zimbabwensis]|uniref:Uncharacterized protein n=1 Tax=Trichinella zimbabwensis TaxID=268475 RepID=A0A0V1HR82_9BILA|nr:hypothetical protein T11_2271 [Trichinella zimbabwensis]